MAPIILFAARGSNLDSRMLDKIFYVVVNNNIPI